MPQPLSVRTSKLLADWDTLAMSATYLSRSSINTWREKYRGLGPYRSLGSIATWFFHPISYRARFTYFRCFAIARARNRGYVQKELESNKDWFDSVESNPLTEMQRRAVVLDENNCLVIAGAGTGKTSAVVAKAGSFRGCSMWRAEGPSCDFTQKV